MNEFESFDGTRLTFYAAGSGDPVLLLHGFASDSWRNWDRTGVVEALNSAGYRTIALDARGHGRSDKPHEVSAYEDGAMRRDAQALLDHLGIEKCRVVGYSMGARVTVALLLNDKRPQSAVLGGIGYNFFRTPRNRERIADALLADDPSTFEASPRAFRSFADATKADKQALSACMRAESEQVAEESLGGIDVPTLVISGDGDTLAGPPSELGQILGGQWVVVSGDHLSAVGDPLFIKSIVKFFDEK